MADYSDAYRSFQTSTTTMPVQRSEFDKLRERVEVLETEFSDEFRTKYGDDDLGQLQYLKKENERLEEENQSLRQSLLDLEEAARKALG